MNWDPAMLEPSHLAMWRIVLGWVIGLPLIIVMFMFFTLTSIVSIEWVDSALKREVEKAGPIKALLLSIFVAPVLALVFQVFLFVVILTAFSDNRERY